MVMQNAIPTKSDSLYKKPTVKDLFPSNQKKKTTGFKSFFKTASSFSLFSLACFVMNEANDISKINSLRDTAICEQLLLPWKEFLDIDTSNISCVLLRSIEVSLFR